MSPALTKRQRKRLLKKEKAFKHREDAIRRQNLAGRARAQEQKQKQTETEKKLDADFQANRESGSLSAHFLYIPAASNLIRT